MQNEELRAAQLARESSRSRYASLYDFAPVAYFTLSETGAISQCNLAAAQLLGYERKGLLGHSFPHFVRTSDQATFFGFFRELTGGEAKPSCPLAVLTRQGKVRHLRLEGNRWSPPQGQTEYLLAAMDVTQQRKAERELLRVKEGPAQRATDKYLTLFNSMDEGFCIVEMLFGAQGEPVDYRFLEINPAFEKQTGLKDAVGKTMRQLEPAHEQHWFQVYGQVAWTGASKCFQQRAEKLAGGVDYEVYAFRVGQLQDRVALLGGTVTFATAPGQGTRITIRVPATP